MGSGTASGIVGSPPPGVIAREHESWPRIPKKLLKKTPEDLQNIRDGIMRRLRFKETESIFPRQGEIDVLEHSAVIVDFAITAVTRMQQTGVSRG